MVRNQLQRKKSHEFPQDVTAEQFNINKSKVSGRRTKRKFGSIVCMCILEKEQKRNQIIRLLNLLLPEDHSR